MSDTFRTHDGRTLDQAASDLVSREVHLCLSSMVFALVGGDHACSGEVRVGKPLRDLMEQALDLCSPVLDYEEAARQAGIKHDAASAAAGEWPWYVVDEADEQGDHDTRAVELDGEWRIYFETAEEACAEAGADPYEWEVFEHWAVSTWLAEKLQATGERVDTDFAGLNVWGRTTTGQAISMDAVIQTIARELHA